MTCRILTLQHPQEWPKMSQWLQGRRNPGNEAEAAVQEILAAVRERGDAALVDYTRKFDCPDFALPLRVTEQEIARAAATVRIEDREIISAAAANIRAFHEGQVERSISSLLMSAIPAQVAGTPRLAVCTPPRKAGSVNPHILAAAHLLDIDEVYRVGGAWSIAALAYGTESLAPVDVIAGPGNIFVTTAKRLVQGQVGIDMIAGPSEVLVVADSSANPAWLAADMLSQAEHDALASAICITDDPRLAEALNMELQKQCAALPRATIAARSLADWGAIVLTPDLNAAVAVANQVAPEHLELCVRDPWAVLPFIRHAGAVLMGQHSPEAVGDYFAGPNHVLPTLGTARFSSALSVQTFCKKTSVVAASSSFLQQNRAAIAALARLEGLEAHARSVEVRGKK